MKNITRKIKLENLPDSELDIMFVLWNSNAPLKASEIMNILRKKRTWKPSTVHTLLQRLEEKNFITVNRASHSHYFSPLITENEFRAAETQSVLTRICDGSIKKMVASLISYQDISEEEIQELTDLLQTKQDEIASKKGEQ